MGCCGGYSTECSAGGGVGCGVGCSVAYCMGFSVGCNVGRVQCRQCGLAGSFSDLEEFHSLFYSLRASQS